MIEIRIENNQNPPGFYCYDITSLSQIPEEKEMLITSNCSFEVTKIEKNKKIKQIREEAKSKNNSEGDINENNDEISTVVYLTCKGNIMNFGNY